MGLCSYPFYFIADAYRNFDIYFRGVGLEWKKLTWLWCCPKTQFKIKLLLVETSAESFWNCTQNLKINFFFDMQLLFKNVLIESMLKCKYISFFYFYPSL